jgi:hypothetical protein
MVDFVDREEIYFGWESFTVVQYSYWKGNMVLLIGLIADERDQ